MESKHTVNNTEVDHSFASVAILASDICKVNSINLCFGTGRIQCEVLTTLPFCFSWIKKFQGQQSKIWDDNSVEKLFR